MKDCSKRRRYSVLLLRNHHVGMRPIISSFVLWISRPWILVYTVHADNITRQPCFCSRHKPSYFTLLPSVELNIIFHAIMLMCCWKDWLLILCGLQSPDRYCFFRAISVFDVSQFSVFWFSAVDKAGCLSAFESTLEHLVVRLFMLETDRNDCRTLLISNLSTMFSRRHWVQINRATRQECGLRRSVSKIKRQNPTAHHRAVEILGDG